MNTEEEEKAIVEDIRDYGFCKAKEIEKKLEKLEERLLYFKLEVEDYEELVYFKKMKKTTYERISNAESFEQYRKIVDLIKVINDKALTGDPLKDIEHFEKFVAIKYDVEGHECTHNKSDLLPNCKCK